MKKGAETVFQVINSRVGQKGIEKVVKSAYPDEDVSSLVSKIMKIFETNHSQKVDKSKDFRSFLKQQKQQISKENEETTVPVRPSSRTDVVMSEEHKQQ